MDANDFQKGIDYAKVRVNKDSDLQWVRNIIAQLWIDEKKITSEEYTCFLKSLTGEQHND